MRGKACGEAGDKGELILCYPLCTLLYLQEDREEEGLEDPHLRQFAKSKSSKSWLEGRQGGFGGSTSKAIFRAGGLTYRLNLGSNTFL